ncbi:MAG: hypothetical protein HOP11_09610 [Saprospiraceae bacterium]|nr:hypothetical protein [Saprospiraceae bacterium]
MRNNKKEKRARRSEHRAQQRAALGVQVITEFYEHYDPKEAMEKLWDMFHHSMICIDRDGINPHEMGEHFFFYDQLRRLLQGAPGILGV